MCQSAPLMIIPAQLFYMQKHLQFALIGEK